MGEQSIAVNRDAGQVAFYINGCLQFDSRDEKIYHEYLARPALQLLKLRSGGALNVLILGGGDGCAARELLADDAVEHIDLVDYDEKVLALGKGDFSVLNRRALLDRKVTLWCQDAKEYLAECQPGYDLVIVDFTFPEDLSAGSLFIESFYSAVKRCLSPDGIIALNAVSPTASSAAYWSIYRTLEGVGLHPRPYHVTIPSFVRHGYGQWGFFLSSARPILSKELRGLSFSDGVIGSRKAFLRSMQFSAPQVLFGQGCARSLRQPSDILWMLNLRLPALISMDKTLDFAGRDPLRRIRSTFDNEQNEIYQAVSDWGVHLLSSLHSMDWEELFRAMEKQLVRLPSDVRAEIEQLRAEGPEALRERLLSRDGVYRALMSLMVVMIVINIVYPDNAYAKGSYYHHSRGHYYSSSSGNTSNPMSMLMPVAATPFHNLPFVQNGQAIVPDQQGKAHSPRKGYYISQSGEIQEEDVSYMLADDLYVSFSGRAYYFIPGSDYFFYLGAEGCSLFRGGVPQVVMRIAMDPQLLNVLKDNLSAQKKSLDKTVHDFGAWLEWAEPSSLIINGMKNEMKEIDRLRRLQKGFAVLDMVFSNYLPPLDDAGYATRLAPGLYLSEKGSLLLRAGYGKWSCVPWRSFYVDPDKTPAAARPETERFIEAVVRWNIQKLPDNDPLKLRLLQGSSGGKG